MSTGLMNGLFDENRMERGSGTVILCEKRSLDFVSLCSIGLHLVSGGFLWLLDAFSTPMERSWDGGSGM